MVHGLFMQRTIVQLKCDVYYKINFVDPRNRHLYYSAIICYAALLVYSGALTLLYKGSRLSQSKNEFVPQ